MRQTHSKGRAAPHAPPDQTAVPQLHRGASAARYAPTHQQAKGRVALPARQCGHGSASRWHVRPGLTCVMSAMQAFFGGNLSLILASLSQSEVRRDYSASVSVSLGLHHVVALERTRSRTHHTAARASHGWQMMQEMTRHPRHLGMELVEHKLHLRRLLWWLMRRCTTSPSRGWWDPWPNSHGARCSGTLRRTARSTAAS